MADFDRLESKIDGLGVKVEAINVLVASMMPRSEVTEIAGKRVLQETYASDQREVSARLSRLESSPVRLLGWLSGGVGCLGVLLSMSSLAFVVLEYVLTHYKP